MLKYYKFCSKNYHKDKEKNEDPYIREGIIVLVDYEEVTNDKKVTIRWKSPNGISYEATVQLEDIYIEEISKEEYLKISESIDFFNNNQLNYLWERAKKIQEAEKNTFKVISS